MCKLSVIMGIYNTKKKEYLVRSINSILNQTFNDFEFIICNDGSTNNCFDWVKEICGNDDRVVFIENEGNKGLAYTLNHCLSVAKGEYIARMDDDDESLLNRFERQVSYLDENPDIAVVSCNINVFDDNGVYSEKIYNNEIRKVDFLFNNPIVHPAVMVRKEMFKKVNGYRDISRTVRVEDYDLFMRMFIAGAKMHVLQDKLFNYRDDCNSLKKRKVFKYRLNESLIRFEHYFKLKLYPIGILFVFKPILIGLIPNRLLYVLRSKRVC